jgi:chromosomal replication initiation ATPase DnaA
METVIEMSTTQAKTHSHNQQDLEVFLQHCQSVVSVDLFEKWFCDLDLVSHNQHEIIVEAKSKFIRDWLNREFFVKNSFTKSLQQFYPQLKKITSVYLAKEESKNVVFETNKVINLSVHNNVFAYGTELNNKFIFG